jgi:hypothetical protein
MPRRAQQANAAFCAVMDSRSAAPESGETVGVETTVQTRRGENIPTTSKRSLTERKALSLSLRNNSTRHPKHPSEPARNEEVEITVDRLVPDAHATARIVILDVNERIGDAYNFDPIAQLPVQDTHTFWMGHVEQTKKHEIRPSAQVGMDPSVR